MTLYGTKIELDILELKSSGKTAYIAYMTDI